MVRRFNSELASLEQANCSAIKAAAAYNSLRQLHCWATGLYDSVKAWFFGRHSSHILRDYTMPSASMEQCVVQYHTTRWLRDKQFSYEQAKIPSNLTAPTTHIKRPVSNKNVFNTSKGKWSSNVWDECSYVQCSAVLKSESLGLNLFYLFSDTLAQRERTNLELKCPNVQWYTKSVTRTDS